MPRSVYPPHPPRTYYLFSKTSLTSFLASLGNFSKSSIIPDKSGLTLYPSAHDL